MFDTHCHLNFSRFKKNIDEVITTARHHGVDHILIPGTDLVSSQKAISIAQNNERIYAAVGIHPHHTFELMNESPHEILKNELESLKILLRQDVVVAIGEVGLDRHIYTDTKYSHYNIDTHFIETQKFVFIEQIKLAVEYNKSLVLHNRESTPDLFEVLQNQWSEKLRGKTVLHCCEPSHELLAFAVKNHIYIGIDGDITYRPDKQQFIKNIPLNLLVLETDSPFLLPEPLRSQKLFPNVPGNIPLIASYIASLLSIDIAELKKITTENALSLFQLH